MAPAKPAKPARAQKGTKAAKGGSDERSNKKAEVIAMMKRPKGATLSEIMDATGWQKHTVRGFVSILGSKGWEKIESAKNGADVSNREAAIKAVPPERRFRFPPGRRCCVQGQGVSSKAKQTSQSSRARSVHPIDHCRVALLIAAVREKATGVALAPGARFCNDMWL